MRPWATVTPATPCGGAAWPWGFRWRRSEMLQRIEAVVETLTPLHIGTGQKLLRDFDFVARGGHTYRLHEERVLEELSAADSKLAEALRRTPPGQLLREGDLQAGSRLLRYVLVGEPQGQEFREAIKDASDRPYLPGSSFKGALRTVLAWHGWKEVKPDLGSALRERRAKFAAQSVERALFGRDPNHDLLRALRVTDSAPGAVTDLQVQLVQVWTKRGAAAPISVEAVRPGVRLALEITVDETLFSDWSRQDREFPLPRREWLDNLARLGTQRATDRLRREKDLWESWGRTGGTNPYQFILAQLVLRKRKEEVSGFPLQLGFGTGWEGMTIGAPLKDDPSWPEVYRHFELGKVPGKRGVSVPPEAFPTSRRVAVGKGNQLALLGWVWVEWRVDP